MKEGQRKPSTPGLTYDGRTKTATVVVIVPGTAGKVRRQRSFENVTRDEALATWRAFRDEVFAEAAAGPDALPPLSARTFAWYFETYWSAIAERTSARTARADEAVIRRRLLPFFGPFPLAAINLGLVRDFVGKMKRDGYSHALDYRLGSKVRHEERRGVYSPATINGTLRVLRKLLKDAEAREVVDRYPLRGKLPMQKEERLALELRGDELPRFLGAFTDEAAFRLHVEKTRATGTVLDFNAGKHAAHVAGSGRRPDSTATGEAFARFRWSLPLFTVALESGLSRSDLLGLTWDRIDHERGIIRVPRRKTGVWSTIPVSEACAEALAECRRRPVVGDLVFLTWAGKPYSASTFERHFEQAKALAGIERRFRIHDLRHSFGSRLATEGVPTSDIARALGHTSARMAERYSRSAEDASMGRIRAALSRMKGGMKVSDPAAGTGPSARRAKSLRRKGLDGAGDGI